MCDCKAHLPVAKTREGGNCGSSWKIYEGENTNCLPKVFYLLKFMFSFARCTGLLTELLTWPPVESGWLGGSTGGIFPVRLSHHSTNQNFFFNKPFCCKRSTCCLNCPAPDTERFVHSLPRTSNSDWYLKRPEFSFV